jgi:hypothetical protein
VVQISSYTEGYLHHVPLQAGVVQISLGDQRSAARFQAAYSAGMHTAQGRKPAAIAVCSSAKKTRFAT